MEARTIVLCASRVASSSGGGGNGAARDRTASHHAYGAEAELQVDTVGNYVTVEVGVNLS